MTSGPEDVSTRGTFTRADLVRHVRSLGYSQRQAARLVDSLLQLACGALENHEPLRLRNFGTFEVKRRAERVARDFHTGEPVRVRERHVVVFRPAAALRRALSDTLLGAEERR